MRPLATDAMTLMRRMADADGLVVHWTGGLKSAERMPDQWQILPVFFGGKPCVNGYYSKADLQTLMRERELRLIAVEQISWTNGEFNGHWAPAIPGLRNFMLGPADLWGNIAHNLALARLEPCWEMAKLHPEAYARLLDAEEEPERLARSISLSLRNLDRSVHGIADYYHEELVNGLAAGRVDGLRYSSTRDQDLYARVHSFFLHLGSVRDYLGTFVALQLGHDTSDTDSMARLVGALRGDDPGVAASALLGVLITNGYVAPIGAPSRKWKLAGWLDDATGLRNEFVHRRTYGHKTAEHVGRIIPIDSDNGIYRYHRPLLLDLGEFDVYDVVVFHYAKINALLLACAHASGHDATMMTLTDDDLISVTETKG